MERLTTDSGEMICRYEDCYTCEEYCPHINEDNCPCLQEILEKLAGYEKIGTVEDFEKAIQNVRTLSAMYEKLNDQEVAEYHELVEYRSLEEQGRLLKLPCALGDTTFWISDEDEDGNKIMTVREGKKIIGIAVKADGIYIIADGDEDYQNHRRHFRQFRVAGRRMKKKMSEYILGDCMYHLPQFPDKHFDESKQLGGEQ